MTKAKDTAHITALQREVAELRDVRIPQQEEHTAHLEDQYRKATPETGKLGGGSVFNGDRELFTTLPTARAHLAVLRSQLKDLERALENAQAEAAADTRAKALEGERATLSKDLTTARRDIAAGRARLAELEAEERTHAAALEAAHDKEAEALLDGMATDPDTVPKAERAHALAHRMVGKLRERIMQLETERESLMSRITDIDADIDGVRLLLYRCTVKHHLDALIPPLLDTCDTRYRLHGFLAAESEIPDLDYLVRVERANRASREELAD